MGGGWVQLNVTMTLFRKRYIVWIHPLTLSRSVSSHTFLLVRVSTNPCPNPLFLETRGQGIVHPLVISSPPRAKNRQGTRILIPKWQLNVYTNCISRNSYLLP